MTSEPMASVVIVTKNRRDDALRAVRSAVAQRPPVELLVVDDGSSDGTVDALAGAFPGVRIERFDDSEGYIVRRNQAAALASAPIVVSIVDDDAEFPADDVVATTVAEFDDPVVGAVAIPYVDLPDEHVRQHAEGEGVELVHRFRGTAYAVRRDVFLHLDGFRAKLVHQAEEADFCLRLLNSGHVVRLGRAAPIRHHASPTRDLERVWFYECRNGVLFAWHNVPMPDLLTQLAKTTLHMLWLGRGVRRTALFARGLRAGFTASLRDPSGRKPVDRKAWKLYKRLGKRTTTLEDIRVSLAELQSSSAPGGAA